MEITQRSSFVDSGEIGMEEKKETLVYST